MSSRSFLFPVPVISSSGPLLANNRLSNYSSYVKESVSSNETRGDREKTSKGLQKEKEVDLEEYLSDDSDESSKSLSPKLGDRLVKTASHHSIREDKDSSEAHSSESSHIKERDKHQSKKSDKQKILKKKKKHKKEEDLDRKKSRKKRKHGRDDSESRESTKRKTLDRSDSTDSGDSGKYKSHKKKKKKKHKHKKMSTFRGRYAKERYPDLPAVVPGRVFIEDIQSLSSKRPYRTDRQGDTCNLAYGGIYSQNLARRKCLDSLCLGLSGEQKIFLTDKKAAEKTLRYYSHSFLGHSKQKAEPVSIIHKVLEDYIHLEDPVVDGYSQSREVNPLGIYDKVTELYLQGKGKPDTQSSQLPLGLPDHVTSEETQQMADYNSRLNDKPNDVELWLEFVKFQEKAVLVGKIGTDRLNSESSTKTLRKSVLEIKMAVLQKAIEKNPSSLKLKLAQLELGQDLWESDELLKEWNSLLFHHANNGPLWLKYLEFRESWSSRFTVSGVLKAYQKALRTLDKVVKGEMKSHPADRCTVWYMLAILKQACRMLLQAGHTEKAIAIYQALIEYNLFMPEILLSAALEDRKEFFDAFWESSAPRVGDTTAMGWSVWIEKKGLVDGLKPWIDRENEEDTEDAIVKQTTSIWHTWIAMETSRSHRHWLPWRSGAGGTDKEDGCEDPDRQVLCDDVTSCLVSVTTEREKFELVCQFLDLLGVDIIKSGTYSSLFQGSNVKSSTDVLPLSSLNVSGLLKQVENTFASESYRVEDFVCNVFNQIVPKFSMDYRQLLYKILIQYRVDLCKKKVSPVKDVKHLKKWVKSLLKEEQNRTSVALWEAYALFEWEFASRDDVYKVLTVTIAGQKDSVLTGCSILEKTLLCRLYRACAELQLGIRSLWADEFVLSVTTSNKDSVLCVLYSLVTGEKMDSTCKLNVSKSLKTKRAFEEVLDKLLGDEEDGYIVREEDMLRIRYYGSLLTHWCTCNAYFLYLTEGFRAAEAVFHKVLGALKDAVKRPEIETVFDQGVQYHYLEYCEMYRSYIYLCKYHTDTTPAPLKTLREPLLNALDELPSSPILLTLYVELESHASISGRVRQYFRSVAPHSDSVVLWLFAVLAEFTRKRKLEEHEAEHEIHSSTLTAVKETGVTHQIRAWLDRAVSHTSARQCVLLWRLYANFEVAQGRVEQAKAVFYRALQQCPGEKALYVDMVRSFCDQLNELTDLMIERELRLRTPLEEVDILREEDTQEVDILRQGNTQEVDILREGDTQEVDTLRQEDAQEVDILREGDTQEVDILRDGDTQEVDILREGDTQEVDTLREELDRSTE